MVHEQSCQIPDRIFNAAVDEQILSIRPFDVAHTRGMSLGYGVVQLDVTIVNTALVSIGSPLGGGLAELQWAVSAAGAAIWRGASKRLE